MRTLWVLGFAVLGFAAAQSPQVLLDRALDEFEAGKFTESAVTWDSLVKARPDLAPQFWQRGIALYYAKRYDDCRKQFESHRTVNPADVENAAWHFLCVARAESPEKAKTALLPVGPDARVPMREIYELYAGRMTPDQVLAEAGNGASAQFFGHMYLGLYFEALGQKDRALEHIRTAADNRYERSGGYMHIVARLHLRALTAR